MYNIEHVQIRIALHYFMRLSKNMPPPGPHEQLLVHVFQRKMNELVGCTNGESLFRVSSIPLIFNFE